MGLFSSCKTWGMVGISCLRQFSDTKIQTDFLDSANLIRYIYIKKKKSADLTNKKKHSDTCLEVKYNIVDFKNVLGFSHNVHL